MRWPWAMTVAQSTEARCYIYISCSVCAAFFSTLLYANEIHWGVKYCSGRIPVSQLGSEETNAPTVADVATSCLTWQWGLKMLQQNTFGTFPHKQDVLFKTRGQNNLKMASELNETGFFLYAHESITAVLFTPPLNQTSRCRNAFGKDVRICETTTTTCGSITSPGLFSWEPTIKRRGMFFNGIHTAPNQQSARSQSCPQRKLKGGFMIAGMIQHLPGFSVFPIRWF